MSQVREVAGLPRDDEGSPVFKDRWQAQAFAMAVKLHEAGVFSWCEWSDRLAQEIQRAQAASQIELRIECEPAGSARTPSRSVPEQEGCIAPSVEGWLARA